MCFLSPPSVGSRHFLRTSEQSHPWSLITPPPRTSRAAGKRQGRKRDRKVQQVLAAVKQRSPTPPPASQPPRTCACAARYLSARAVIDGLGGAGFLSLSETRSTHRTGVHPSHHIFKLRGTPKPHTTHVLQFDVQRARACKSHLIIIIIIIISMAEQAAAGQSATSPNVVGSPKSASKSPSHSPHAGLSPVQVRDDDDDGDSALGDDRDDALVFFLSLSSFLSHLHSTFPAKLFS